MAYNFKNLADVELLEAMPEEANVLVEVNGATKRAPQKMAVNGEGGSGGEMLIITGVYNANTQEESTTANMSYSELRGALVDLRAPLGFMKSMIMYEGETDWRFAQYSCANYELKEHRITLEYGDGGSWDYLENGTIQQRPM